MPASTRPEVGFLGVRDEGIVGWAWDPERPNSALDVDLLLGDEYVETTRADVADPELATRGIGDGSHAFHFKLDRIPNVPCELFARVAGTDVTFGPLVIENNVDLAKALAPQTRYEGMVDDFMRNKGRIHGWVWDKMNPSRRVRVTLRDWNEPLSEVKADIYRQGLEHQKKSDGKCAFAIRLPVTPVLDGRPHTLRITVEDTDYQLPGSPIHYDPAMARELVEVIALWREDVLRIEAALSRLDQLVEQLEAKRRQPTLAEKLTNVFDNAAVGDKLKERLKRLGELVGRVFIASVATQGVLEEDCFAEGGFLARDLVCVEAAAPSRSSDVATEHGIHGTLQQDRPQDPMEYRRFNAE